MTASTRDFAEQMRTVAPLVFGFVLLFAFGLMLVSFRSIVIAAKAVLLNLLSIGAAYGILVLVFQHGWGKGLLGFEFTGGIDPFLPILLFVILFGLSMDYHVFILSRIREAYDGGMSTDEAIAHGIKTSAGVVTSAAIVMVGVFAIFGALQAMIFKQFGVGLAAAILIDATIVRAILLPATMKLLGDWNWYLPKWLEWLPHFEHGGSVEHVDAPPAPAPTGSPGVARRERLHRGGRITPVRPLHPTERRNTDDPPSRSPQRSSPAWQPPPSSQRPRRPSRPVRQPAQGIRPAERPRRARGCRRTRRDPVRSGRRSHHAAHGGTGRHRSQDTDASRTTTSRSRA